MSSLSDRLLHFTQTPWQDLTAAEKKEFEIIDNGLYLRYKNENEDEEEEEEASSDTTTADSVVSERIARLYTESWDNLSDFERAQLKSINPTVYNHKYFKKYGTYPAQRQPTGRDRFFSSMSEAAVGNIVLSLPGGIHFPAAAKKMQLSSSSEDWVVHPDKVANQEPLAETSYIHKKWDDMSDTDTARVKANWPTLYALKYNEKYGKYPKDVKIDNDRMKQYLSEIKSKRLKELDGMEWQELWDEGLLEELKSLDENVYKKKYRKQFGKDPADKKASDNNKKVTASLSAKDTNKLRELSSMDFDILFQKDLLGELKSLDENVYRRKFREKHGKDPK